MSRDSFNLRMVRVWLNDDKTEYEILATNLPREQFPAECFGEIYHLRWRIMPTFLKCRHFCRFNQRLFTLYKHIGISYYRDGTVHPVERRPYMPIEEVGNLQLLTDRFLKEVRNYGILEVSMYHINVCFQNHIP